MSISTLSGIQSSSSLGLIQGTGASQTQSVNTVMGQGQTTASSAGKTTLSQNGQSMSQLQQLASSNPSEFKAATQKISTDLATAAKSETDPAKSKFLEKLSEKFAQASQSGKMPALQPHSGGIKHGQMGGGSSVAGKYAGQQMSGMFSQVGSIISNDLSSFAGASASTSGSTASAAVSASPTSITDSGSVAGSGSTAT